MTPRDIGLRARELLEDQVLNRCLNDIREKLVSQLEATAMGDVETHHEVAISLQLLKRVRAQLKQYADSLTISEHNAREENFMQKMRKSLKMP
jgi:hypothetical protein